MVVPGSRSVRNIPCIRTDANKRQNKCSQNCSTLHSTPPFNTKEFNTVNDLKTADYSITIEANTATDISSDVLKENYNLNLVALTVTIFLKNKANEILYSTKLPDIYGYANSTERAGINAYNNQQLTPELSEALFFVKRKIVNY